MSDLEQGHFQQWKVSTFTQVLHLKYRIGAGIDREKTNLGK